LLLLCSDGLTGELEDAQIQQLCSNAQTLDELVEQLLAQANAMGGKDNISCIVLGRDAAVPSAPAKPRGLLSRLFTSRKP
jgi:PPM family protein phosphatase